MRILGIETSCDETAAAVVVDGTFIESNQVYTQIAAHKAYGGVVPEIASRHHVEHLPEMIRSAMAEANVDWTDLNGIAVTAGPGLASSLLIGLTAARSLALRTGLPFIPVNHLEGHLYSLGLGAKATQPIEALCPLLVLLVTGGHTMMVRMEAVGRYQCLGQTLDDAVGEALDKGAKLLGLGYPGGPEIEKLAEHGDSNYMQFPRGLEHPAGRGVGPLDRSLCFSYSGVKTSLLYQLKKLSATEIEKRKTDVAASYQEAVFDALLMRVRRALERNSYAGIACVGGVARNKRLRSLLDHEAARARLPLHLAPLPYCTDNAAMIAALAGHPAGPKPVKQPSRIEVFPNLGIDQRL